jgi:ribosomal-protein-alanine N-acetyltransferase
MNLPIVETDRLILRTYVQAELETVYLMVSDQAIRRFFPDGPDIKREDVMASLPKRTRFWKDNGFGQFGVFEKAGGKMAGYCGLKYLDNTTEVEVYYGFFRDSWGKGYATESAAAALRFGFQETPLNRIVGVTHTENFASQKVLKKIGLKYEKQAFSYGMDVNYFSIGQGDYSPSDAPYILSFKETDDE